MGLKSTLINPKVACPQFAVKRICSHNAGIMRKSTYSKEYEVVKDLLVEMRMKAGLTQRELAKSLGREHSFVWRIEKGERRLDVVEFAWVCQALKQDPAAAYRRVIRGFRLQDNGHAT